MLKLRMIEWSRYLLRQLPNLNRETEGEGQMLGHIDIWSRMDDIYIINCIFHLGEIYKQLIKSRMVRNKVRFE